MIQLKTFNRKELEDFVLSGAFQQYDFLPVTKHRALSQVKNPEASDEDTLLILAFCEDKLAGYVGCFPDGFKVNGEKISYAWLSTLYVNPEFRKERPAKKLLKKFLKNTKEELLSQNLPEKQKHFIILWVFLIMSFRKKGSAITSGPMLQK